MDTRENQFEISNIDDIYKGDFDTMVKLEGLEVFNLATVTKYYDQFGNILQKGEENELTEQDNSTMALIKAEVDSLKRWVVLDDKFQKSVMFTRVSQVDLQKGIYKDTALNKKLGRVGIEFKLKTQEATQE